MKREHLPAGLVALLAVLVAIWVLVLAGVYFLASPFDFETTSLVLAVIGILLAAFLAWRAALERQSRRERQIVNRLVVRGDAIATELMMVADRATDIGAGAGALSESLGTLARASIVTVAEIQSHLAAALSTNLLDLDQLRQKQSVALGASANDPSVAQFRQEVRDFAFRTEALAVALQNARVQIEAGGEVSRDLLQRTDVAEIAARRGSTMNALSYVRRLMLAGEA